MKFSIIILHYGDELNTIHCIRSILKSDYSSYEIIVVDNGNQIPFIFDNPLVRIIRSEINLKFAGGFNLGIPHAKSEYVILLSNDTTIEKNCLNEIRKVMDNDLGLGIASPLILDSNGHIYCAGTYKYWLGYTKHLKNWKHHFYAQGACIIVRNSVLKKVGGFNKDFVIYYEDVELSWRIKKAGWKLGKIENAIIFHEGSHNIKFVPNYEKSFYIRRNRLLCHYYYGCYINIPFIILSYLLLNNYKASYDAVIDFFKIIKRGGKII